MTRSRRLSLKAGMVLLLGTVGLLATPPVAEAKASFVCWESCSEALFETYCHPPAEGQCHWDPWGCQIPGIDYWVSCDVT